MSGVYKLSVESQVKVYHAVVSKETSNTISKKRLVASEKVTPSEEVLQYQQVGLILIMTVRNILYTFEPDIF